MKVKHITLFTNNVIDFINKNIKTKNKKIILTFKLIVTDDNIVGDYE